MMVSGFAENGLEWEFILLTFSQQWMVLIDMQAPIRKKMNLKKEKCEK